MKKHLISVISSILTAAFALSFAAFADISDFSEVQSVTAGVIAYELRKTGAESIQEWANGSLADNAGKSSEWFAMILARRGDIDLSAYRASLTGFIGGNEVKSATSRMKNALALIAVGGDRSIAEEIAESSVGEQGIMSLIYGLHLLNNGCVCSSCTVVSVTHELLSMQFTDGGWAIMGENGDIDVTAMAVQALAPQYDTDEAVHAAVDRAVSFLSLKQQDDGGYTSFGTANPESAAQVLIAVSSLGIDVTDGRFVKSGNTLIDGIVKYRLEDGSFSHTEGGETNETATVQACLSLTAYMLMRESGQMFFIFPGISSAPEPSPKTSQTGPAQTEEEPAASPAPTTSAPPAPPSPSASGGYKPAAYCVIAGLGAAACVILVILKKRRASNFVAVVAIAGAAAAFVFFTDFRSGEDYYSGTAVYKENAVGTVTMSIRCDTLVGKTDSPYVPSDGVILAETSFDIADGDTAYDILTEAAKRFGLQLQSNGGYIAGIAYLYEYDYGDLSGWIYHVNGDAPFVMCTDCKLSDGDRIEWLYTCELGNDL